MAATSPRMLQIIIEAEELPCLFMLSRQRKRKRRWSARPLHVERHAKVKQMRATDEEMHLGYFRMSTHRFDDLLNRI